MNKKSALSFLFKEILRAFLIGLWFVLLTFPILGMNVMIETKTIGFTSEILIFIFFLAFVTSILFRLRDQILRGKYKEALLLTVVKTDRQQQSWHYFKANRLQVWQELNDKKAAHSWQNMVKYFCKAPFTTFKVLWYNGTHKQRKIFTLSLATAVLVFIFAVPDFSYNSIFSTLLMFFIVYFIPKMKNDQDNAKKTIIFILAIFLVTFPWFANSYRVTVFNNAIIYMMLALGLHIVIGLGGMLNLGYVAFYAIGAYSYGILVKYLEPIFMTNDWNTLWLFWIALPLSGLTSVLLALIIVLPTLRLRGDYLAIVTLAFAEILRILFVNLDEITGGPTGISSIPKPVLFGLKGNMSLYYISLTLFIVAYILVKRLERSHIGREWEAMREDAIASRSMGINLNRTKIRAFCLGALWAGFAGVLQASRTSVITPASFSIWTSVLILAAVILGGLGSSMGAILGAIIVVLLPEDLRFSSQYQQLIFGIVLFVIMLVKPSGLLKQKREHYHIDLDKVKGADDA